MEEAQRDPARAARLEEGRKRLDAEIAAYHRTLPQLRKARALTQQALAEWLQMSQGDVSKLERRTDLYLSTLAEYVEGLGGRLELVAVFGEDRVPLSIGDLAAEDEPGDTAGDLAAS